jgi:putative oxidoreductase
MRMVKLAGTWTLQILFGALFVVLGSAKFGDPSWVRKFADWGYPDGFYMVVGVFEIAGGLMVLVPRVASYGALVIATVMIGAALTHLVHGEMQRLSGPLMFLAIAAAVAWLRRSSAARPARTPARKQAVI